MKKVTQEQLEQLQKFVNTINEGQATIGGLEVQKQEVIKEVQKMVADLKALQSELEKEYGNVTVNLTTGEITEAEDADNPQD